MRFHAAILIAFSVILTGCIHTQIDETAPSSETLKLLRNGGMPPLSIGTFLDAGGKIPIGRTINIRGSTMRPPKGGNFADFLRLSFEAELKAAGKYDSSSPIAISAKLTESRASENMSRGSAVLAAEFSVRRAGNVTFSKPYKVDTQWKSDFIGAIAIPEALRQYNALYPLLVRTVFSDPEFLQALKK